MRDGIREIATMLLMRDQYIAKTLKDYPVMTQEDYEVYISEKLGITSIEEVVEGD